LLKGAEKGRKKGPFT
jgi:hypothetical protein